MLRTLWRIFNGKMLCASDENYRDKHTRSRSGRCSQLTLSAKDCAREFIWEMELKRIS